ncbi:kinesin-like protein KIN-7F [Nymphaea colorata]|nr:kinesin-like protein KIN-7F [Nymphaea colorata]XP_031476167.1 kinesin-like protein KIN-7F [Nymphaea colorata]XP_031476168.1 kinesin-like protein KIN-7F [Nymphaea colorata]
MGEVGTVDLPEKTAIAGQERILVSVRVRPLNEKEIARNDPSDWECINDNTILCRNNLPERALFPTAYTFDHVFNCDTPTRRVYEAGAKEVALSVVRGINSTVFAYGQTSSGKTFTMSGITEYTVADIYDYVRQHEERAFLLKFSAMEIYNEAVRDLLSTDSTPLRLLDDPERGTVVERLTEETLKDWNHMQHLLSICEAQRQIGETALNETSSRSHQILRLTVESSTRGFLGTGNSSTLVASVNFVDLAGSERASQVLGTGARLKEGCHINRSLLTLGTVIRKLSKGRNGHIPYRDSKLTRILHSSLGGNARTAIICTMSPARSHTEQSRNTLLFASCAKEVATNAQVNVVMSDKALVKHLQRELARLETELRTPTIPSPSHHSDEMLKEKDDKIRKMEKEINELIQQRDLAQSRLENLLQVIGTEQPSRQWEEPSGAPASDALDLCKDELLISESFGRYQELICDLEVLHASQNVEVEAGGANNVDPVLTENHVDSYVYSLEKEEDHIDYNEVSSCTSFSPKSTESIPHLSQGVVPTYSSEDFEVECKDVRCVQADESSTDQKLDCKSSFETEEAKHFADDRDISENESSGIHLKDITETDSFIAPVDQKCENMKKFTGNLYSPYPDETSYWPLNEGFNSSRSLKLTRSRSCRAAVTTASSPFWEDYPNDSTPPSRFEKYFPGRPETVKRPPTLSFSATTEALTTDTSNNSNENTFDVQKAQYKFKTAAEENISSIRNFVEELKDRMAKLQCQKQLNGEEVQASVLNDESYVTEDLQNAKFVEAVPEVVVLDSVETPDWSDKFEKQQRMIVELWHACNVSLIHRSSFFLLFDGDQADSIYMEVELRRLSFLKNKYFNGDHDNNFSIASSARALKREREMLAKLMHKRLSAKEREALYEKWDIRLDSKQRRLQLARRVWTNTSDMNHVRESALLVAHLDGFQEPGMVLKEMFELSFTPQRSSRSLRHSSSWKPL